ncbi:MAG: cytochrome C biogenesis protein [Nanoarchaeota archaeon]|nr:cytochrome C biogenesis protein [Nanoarchaeota archaeon]|tara:strand:+ start:1517 stop:2275 length:759 start_codon:yes stop_codon:yes gene_type:complete
MEQKRDWNIFISSVFFVLGFSVIFSLVGVLLQSVLSSISFTAQAWLGRIGGVVIIVFGLYLLGLIKPKFLEKEHKLQVKRKFKSSYVTSFVFGAAFAVGWTPCIGAVLGAILTLAIANPSSAFFLLLSYSIGLGIPFLLVGFFTNQSKVYIDKIMAQSWTKYLTYLFGLILIVLGILVFTSQLARFANLQFASNILLALDSDIAMFGSLNLGIAFIAGIVSFLSPCVLPLIPAYLTYLASTAIKKEPQQEDI